MDIKKMFFEHYSMLERVNPDRIKNKIKDYLEKNKDAENADIMSAIRKSEGLTNYDPVDNTFIRWIDDIKRELISSQPETPVADDELQLVDEPEEVSKELKELSAVKNDTELSIFAGANDKEPLLQIVRKLAKSKNISVDDLDKMANSYVDKIENNDTLLSVDMQEQDEAGAEKEEKKFSDLEPEIKEKLVLAAIAKQLSKK